MKLDLLYEVLVPEEMRGKSRSLHLEGNPDDEPLMLKEETISGHLQEKCPYFDAPNRRRISLCNTGREYGISPKQIKAIACGCYNMTALIFAFIIAMVVICGGIYLSALGKPLEGFAAIITALVALVGAFVYDKYHRR